MFAKAKYLAAASAVEYGFQLLVPIYLVRVLSEGDFASYRFMWLLVGTLVGAALLNVPASLSYFLPRSEQGAQAGYIAQSVAFTATVGALAFAALLGVTAGFPGAAMVALLPKPIAVFGSFVVLLCATATLDHLGTARGDVRSQAGLNLTSAIVRAACVVVGASFGSITSVCWALLAFAGFRLCLLAGYLARSVAAPVGPALSVGRFRQQFLYAAPFGVASAFWMFRSQAEQWIGAAVLTTREYAALSIAAAVIPIFAIVQQSLTASSVAEVNRLEAQGRIDAMVRLNARSNQLAAAWLFPLVAFVFVASEPLVGLVYTAKYLDAALVLKLLCIGFVGGFIEVSSLAKALRMQREVLRFDATMLFVSVAVSLLGAWRFGLTGIVLGSLSSRFVSTAYFIVVLSRRTGVPVAQMQNWRAMGRCLLAAVGAGCLSWLILAGPMGRQPQLVQVITAAATMATAWAIAGFALRLPMFRRAATQRPDATRDGNLGSMTVPGSL